MKACLHLSFLCSLTLASGCVLTRDTVIAAPVGPPPLAAVSAAANGTLVVFTAEDFGTSGDELAHYYSGYSLYPEDGKRLKFVPNRAGRRGDEPAKVSLPPGRYRITARAAAFGTVTVPVVLQAGKTTSVHLDGSEPLGSSRSGSEFVTLPDGLAIGWRVKDVAEEK